MLSVVVPVYNEKTNLSPLEFELDKVLKNLKIEYEIIFVNDGSTDGSLEELKKLKKKNKKIKIINFRKNFGQTAAMDAGFKESIGDIIIPMDADLQNDPKDIPRLIKKLNTGYDVVSGWRYNRKDDFFKKFFSKIANFIRKSLTGERIHDSGCTLKAYRKECFENISLSGEMHRYIPAILMWKGFKIGELKVRHNKRKFGKTKYSAIRVFKGFFDLLVVVFWQKYSTKPIHFFGFLGLITEVLGILLSGYLIYMRLFHGLGIGNRPLFILAILMIIVGIQFIIFGLLADILLKNYYKDSTEYTIENIY